MPCYSPLNAHQSKHKKPNGKTYLSFGKKGHSRKKWTPIKVPCGQCIGCRLERSRQWAVRCVHETKLHEKNCFITLTFNQEHLDKNKSLVKRDFQLFMKRLRKKFVPPNPFDKETQEDEWKEFHEKHRISYFHCGEYGSQKQRPHHHAILFNIDFDDKLLWKEHNNEKYYTSETLSSLWTNPKTKASLGHCCIGEANFETAAYVARYITKKITGEAATTYYNELDYQTGEILIERIPEYTTMSRNPAIGKRWYEKFNGDWYYEDKLIMRGQEMKPPKYYDKQYEIAHPEEMEQIKEKRKEHAKKSKEHTTEERLAVRNRNKLRQTSNLKRGYEDQTQI